MPDLSIRKALFAVYDKTDVADFAKALVKDFGIEIISTGGTARHLKEAGVPVTLVEEITGFPEMLDGRVKTLHPKIHAAILADRNNPDHLRQLEAQEIKPIDMVVVNLYPFKDTIRKLGCTFEDAIEMIDIGGPCLLRAAAKNHKGVLPICSQESMHQVWKELRDVGKVSDKMRLELATRTFDRTRGYDEFVSAYFMEQETRNLARAADIAWEDLNRDAWLDFGEETLTLTLKPKCDLRYGENPHQFARLFVEPSEFTDHHSSDIQLIPKEETGQTRISYNNLVDADAAAALCQELSLEANATGSSSDSTVSVFVKHTNACGVGLGRRSIEAYERAYLGDPNAAMGGVLCQNTQVDAGCAEYVMASLDRWGRTAGAQAFFVEVWIAPSFDEEAVRIIRSRKKWGERVQLLSVGEFKHPPNPQECLLKCIPSAVLVQSRDLRGLDENQWKIVTDRGPTDREMADLRLAWLVCKHTKSNAISVCKDGMLIGNGAGQMSRVMSCRIAAWLAKENGHENKLMGSVAASDAFFPFRDGPDILAEAGVSAIIQPGGSKRDEETIAACNERQIAMVFTGTRHFKH